MIVSIQLSILLLISTYSFSQNIQLDGRSLGVGNLSSVVSNNMSQMSNPGAAENISHHIFIGYSSSIHPDLKDITAGYMSVLGNLGLTTSIARYGSSMLNYHQFSLAANHKLGIASLGFRTSYHQLFIEGYGSKSIFSVDFGGLASIGEKIKVGSFIRNISNSGFNKDQLDYLPTSFVTGVQYESSNRVSILAELEQSLSAEHLNVKVGLEYLVHEQIALRAGINTFPRTNNFGIGFSIHRASLDLGLVSHQFLGVSQTTSLSIQIQ